MKAADLLLNQGEAEFAISRAYYGMFYAVEALLLVKGLQFRKHGGVHAAFGEHFVKTGLFHRKYHRWLLDGYDRRILGDYQVGPAITAEESRRTIDQAREFLAEAVKHIGMLREK